MSKQPGYQNAAYKLFDSGFASLMQLKRGPLSKWPAEDRKALYDSFRSSFDSLQDELEDAENNGKQVLLKEHAIFLSGPDKLFAHIYGNDETECPALYERDAPDSTITNPTSVPDSLLLSLRPIFQIRHPILMFPSALRAERKTLGPVRPRDPLLASTMTLARSRALYDWYLNHGGDNVRPQVIDADDIINDRAAVRQLCIKTGLDPDAVLYEWETREEKDPMKAVFLSTITGSKGIIPGLAARGLDLEEEKAKWKAEFGDEDGEDLAKYVLDAMPDYNYLLGQRTYVQKAVGQE
ncbi:hypothetical protein C7974DRAFT_431184 [Boeremia exigua]|uniref:uncharacterized protein n=1 Tax=Boeremia exigua TaxID=749465 RepID=UPI001E8E3D1D|nr:uncharacterized protein C7974DRAFT_431184 [Boeremia exigua]KAH6642829.1 hypothetical protein C7974DRAFT_431184 [Boeremia exigua]